MAVPSIKLIRYKDPNMAEAIYYWVLITDKTVRIGPHYFTIKEDAQTWADQNGYKYK